jgi:bifunctional non-homologous end joining protein LigD
VGTGYDEKTLKDLRSKMEKLKRKSSPYDEGNPGKKETHFITPKLVCEVAFTEWTNDDKLRHPRYKGLRTDIDPKNVHKEAETLKTDL